MNNRYIFGVCPCDSVECRELANTYSSQYMDASWSAYACRTKCCDESRNALHSGVSVCCVSSVEFVAVADPVKTAVLQMV